MWSTTSLVFLPLPGVQVACHQPLINERGITHSEIVSAVSCLNISREKNLEQLTSHTEARKHLCVQCYVMLQALDGRWYTALSCDLPTRLTTSEVEWFHLHGCWILLPFLQSLITFKKFFDMFSVSPAILPSQWFEHFGFFFVMTVDQQMAFQVCFEWFLWNVFGSTCIVLQMDQAVVMIKMSIFPVCLRAQHKNYSYLPSPHHMQYACPEKDQIMGK